MAYSNSAWCVCTCVRVCVCVCVSVCVLGRSWVGADMLGCAWPIFVGCVSVVCSLKPHTDLTLASPHCAIEHCSAWRDTPFFFCNLNAVFHSLCIPVSMFDHQLFDMFEMAVEDYKPLRSFQVCPPCALIARPRFCCIAYLFKFVISLGGHSGCAVGRCKWKLDLFCSWLP